MKLPKTTTIIRLALFFALLAITAYSYGMNKFNIKLSSTKVSAACDHTECVSGETSVGSCGAPGCGANQRIYCPCQPPGTVGGFWCFGGCYCVDDASCNGGGSCTNGTTGGCGTNGCSSGQTSLCVSGSWTCVSSSSCGYVPGCTYNPSSPSGCTTEGGNTPYPPGTCSGGSNSGAGCVYDSTCTGGGTCNIPNQNRCCSGLEWNYPINGNCVCPTCNATNPSSISLVSPANGITNISNTVTLDWTNVSSWGTGCPQTNSYTLKYAIKTGATCPSIGSASYTSVSTGTTSSRTLSNLPWGNTYCWYAQATNGSNTSNSVIWQFSIAKAPTLAGSGIVSAMSCGSSISGNATISGTDNPITFYSEYTLNDNGIGVGGIDQVALAIVPNDYATANVVSETVLNDIARDYFMAIVAINTSDPNQSEYRIINKNGTTGEYSNVKTSGNLTNSSGTATLMNLNNSSSTNYTHVQIVDANTVRVYWQVKFEDQYKYTNTGALFTKVITNNIYTAAFREYATGQWNSSSGSTTIARSLRNIMPWSVNVQVPQVIIGDPTIINDTDFSIKWDASGYGITKAEGYMWSKNQPIELNKLALTPTGLITIPSTEPDTNIRPVPNSNINAYYREGSTTKLGTHRYRITSTANVEDLLNTKMYIQDTACNIIVDSGNALNLSGSWLMTSYGSTYAPDFKFTVKQSTIASSWDYGDYSYLNPYSYVATYLASTLQKPITASSRQSKNSFLLENYNDWNGIVPKTDGSSDIYSYLKKIVAKNATITASSATTIAASTKTKAFLNTISTGYAEHVEITGDFSIAKDVTCNSRTIFFIKGNLSITPNFKIENPNSTTNSCMFIVNGNITIQNGSFKNYYDRVDSFMVTNGNFITLTDKNSSTLEFDGLYIKGGVVAQNTTLGRTFQLLKNLSYPSEIIEFDPRYKIIFAPEFKIQEYSIREKDFLKKVND